LPSKIAVRLNVSFLLPKSRTETVEIAAHLLDLFIGKTSWNPDSSIASEYRISKQLPTTQKHFRFPKSPGEATKTSRQQPSQSSSVRRMPIKLFSKMSFYFFAGATFQCVFTTTISLVK